MDKKEKRLSIGKELELSNVNMFTDSAFENQNTLLLW